MRLLWISPRWPFPADDGAKSASASLLLSLAEKGHDIEVVTFSREQELEEAPHARVKLLAHHRAGSLSTIPRIFAALKNLGSSLPVSAEPFAFALHWKSFTAPAAVVFDGVHGYSAFCAEACPWPVLYRAHNVETSLWTQASERSLLRPYFALQAARMHRFEEQLCKVACGIAAISPEDASAFREWIPGTRVEWIPIGIAAAARPHTAFSGALTFGYIGRLDWPPNRDGLEWFLSEIWPKVIQCKPGLRLKIAGTGNSGWLKKYGGFEWLGRVDSPTEFYAGISATLVPVRYGSGTKIKLVEAAAHGRASFTTNAGFHGSGLRPEHLALLSDSPSNWVEALVSADPDSLALKGAAALTEARRVFDTASAADRFLSLLPRETVG